MKENNKIEEFPSVDQQHPAVIHIGSQDEIQVAEVTALKMQQPKLHWYRWIILILYLIGDLIPSVIITTTTPIASEISLIYSLQPIEVNLSNLVILIAAPVATIFSSKLLDEKGISIGIRIGTLICLGGAWIRTLVNQSFFFVVLGNFLAGLGAPLIFNGKTQVASNWFSHSQGPGVTSFITFWTNMNAIVGFMFSGNYLGDYQYQIQYEDQGRDLIFKLMLLIAFVGSIITLLIWFLFKQYPPSPPSYTSQIEKEHNFKESVRRLLHNRNYKLLMFQQGLFLGSMSGMATSISYYIKPFGFNSQDSTLFLAAIPIGGVLGIIIGSYFLNKYKCYKLQMGIYAAGGIVSAAMLQVTLYLENVYLIIFSTILFGLFFIPMIPTILEFACESVFPIGEGTTVGFLLATSSLFALIYGSGMSFVVKGETKMQTYIGTLIMLISFSLGLILLLFTKENLIRHRIEKIKEDQYNNSKDSIQLTEIISQRSQTNIILLTPKDNNPSNYISPISLKTERNDSSSSTSSIAVSCSDSLALEKKQTLYLESYNRSVSQTDSNKNIFSYNPLTLQNSISTTFSSTSS